MKIDAKVEVNLKVKQVSEKAQKATRDGLRDIVVLIANDAIQGSPVLTGNNRRSIQYRIDELQGLIYSTSGYGGYIETGTVKMAARPYFKPALDRHIGKLGSAIKARLEA